MANEWKAAAVKRMTSGVAFLFKANGVEWVRGTGTFKDANTLAVDGGEDVTFKSAIIATGSFPLRPPIEGLDSDRCVDSEPARADRGSSAPGHSRRRDHRLRVRVDLPQVRQRGDDHRDAPALIPDEDEDASKELAKQFRKRGIALHLGKQCTKVEDSGSELTVHFGDGETVEADLMLVAVGRARWSRARPRGAGVDFDPRTGIATDARRRTSVPHIYAVGDCAGYWQLAHTAFREGEVAAENACGHDAAVGNRAVPRPIYTDPEIASVGLTEAQAREQYGDDVATGMFPWIANARAVMQNETAGWVKSIHATRDGELLGLVMIGPHVTDLVEAGVVAIDAEPPSRPSPTAWRRIPRCPRRSRTRVSSRSAARSTSRTGNQPRDHELRRDRPGSASTASAGGVRPQRPPPAIAPPDLAEDSAQNAIPRGSSSSAMRCSPSPLPCSSWRSSPRRTTRTSCIGSSRSGPPISPTPSHSCSSGRYGQTTTSCSTTSAPPTGPYCSSTRCC